MWSYSNLRLSPHLFGPMKLVHTVWPNQKYIQDFSKQTSNSPIKVDGYFRILSVYKRMRSSNFLPELTQAVVSKKRNFFDTIKFANSSPCRFSHAFCAIVNLKSCWTVSIEVGGLTALYIWYDLYRRHHRPQILWQTFQFFHG